MSSDMEQVVTIEMVHSAEMLKNSLVEDEAPSLRTKLGGMKATDSYHR